MGDLYYKYGAAPLDRGATTPNPSFPGYLSSDVSALASRYMQSSNDIRPSSSDFLPRDVVAPRAGAYGLDGVTGLGVHPEPGFGGLTAGAGISPYAPPPLEDPLLGRREVSLGAGPVIPDIINGRADSLRKVDGLPSTTRESNVLFVDGLADDCTRREVSHLFRPFIGFREIRLVHKEPRRNGDKATVLCFVEFTDAKCALTALEALQGYQFDNKKPESPVLRIVFAHFPFRPPSERDELRFAVPR